MKCAKQRRDCLLVEWFCAKVDALAASPINVSERFVQWEVIKLGGK